MILINALAQMEYLKMNLTVQFLEQVYPNPTNGKFTVIFKQNSHEKTNLIIYNLLGQEVLKRNFTSTQVTLNLPQSSPQGIYFLVIRQGEKIETKKLIVSFNQH